MTRRYARFALALSLASLAGCPSAQECPSGFQRVGEVCVVPTDAATDAAMGMIDAARDAPSADRDTGSDAHVPCNGACVGATPYCVNETCVACLADTDCTTSAAPHCDTATSACAPCTTNADCAHIAGHGLCDGGSCAECTVRNETPCGANSCDPATRACTTTPRMSVATQGACVADSECHLPDRCVPVFFAGVRRPGGFCIHESNAAGCTGCGVMLTESRTSLSGAPAATYCSVDETYATFESHRDNGFTVTCTQDSDCGAPGLDDARCVSMHCFTGCAATCECPGGFGYTCHTDHFCG